MVLHAEKREILHNDKCWSDTKWNVSPVLISHMILFRRNGSNPWPMVSSSRNSRDTEFFFTSRLSVDWFSSGCNPFHERVRRVLSWRSPPMLVSKLGHVP